MGRLKKLLNRSDAHEVGAPASPRSVPIQHKDAGLLTMECDKFYGDVGPTPGIYMMCRVRGTETFVIYRVPMDKEPTDA